MENSIAPHVAEYQALFTGLTDEERHDLAHIKRFLERVVGDPAFRDALGQCNHAREFMDVARSIGADIDPNDILPLFHVKFTGLKGTEEANKQWPKHVLWEEYIKKLRAHLSTVKRSGGPKDTYPELHRWRLRQIIRTNNQLGFDMGHSIVHPLVSFELSDGCSVGCWFCGISAERFNGYWPYSDENAILWQEVQQRCKKLFGTAMQTGFCYWATDPMDNPDYDRFLMDYYRAHNYMPQTTTAAPLKDEAMTRRIMALYSDHRHITNRFSILNLKTLRAVHETFTAEEMMGVEMVLHNKEATRMSKSNAGRAQQKRIEGKSKLIEQVLSYDSTIACVSGFLISMPKKTITMVAPVASSPEWPNGYRIFGEKTFMDADSFENAIHALVAENCSNSIDASQPLAFRHDLSVERVDGRIQHLKSRLTEHNFSNHNPLIQAILADLLPLVEEGEYLPGEVVHQVTAKGHDALLAASVLDNLFNTAVFEEDRKFLRHASEAVQWQA